MATDKQMKDTATSHEYKLSGGGAMITYLILLSAFYVSDERHETLTWYQVTGGGVCARFASVPQSEIFTLLTAPSSLSPSKAIFIVEPWRKKTMLTSAVSMNRLGRGAGVVSWAAVFHTTLSQRPNHVRKHLLWLCCINAGPNSVKIKLIILSSFASSLILYLWYLVLLFSLNKRRPPTRCHHGNRSTPECFGSQC